MIKMWAKPKMASISDHEFISVWKTKKEWGKDYGLSYLQFISYINGLFYLSVIWNISRSALMYLQYKLVISNEKFLT